MEIKKNKDKLYPQITDRILLELICIANKYYIDLEGTDIETMKNSLLENFMFFKRDIKEDIHTLFKGKQQWQQTEKVLDCFSGSGTTAIACHNLKRRFICIEKDYDYWKASVERLKDAQSQLKLF